MSSWTSSLLFAIQYAIYRCDRFRLSPSDVSICVLDPADFPRGQFMRDMTLIRAYREHIVSEFFDFRLNRDDYNNGEHLSQGRVYIA